MHRQLIACVITHGHLDIEWYQPMRSFAFWIEAALDRLIKQYDENKDIPSYTLDGQVYPLEQYLKLRPENEEKIRTLITSGKLRIGPFYTQFDEWIPSPESMVRNCLYGDRVSRKFGTPLKVGYLPDNFGHPAQLPQLLNGFGIDNLLFMRGMPYISENFPDEFTFYGLDGSSLNAKHFRDGYSRIYGKNIENFAEDFIPQFRITPYAPDYISYEHYLEMTTIDNPERHAQEMIAYVRKISQYFPSGVVPVMLGCDHSPPHIGLKAAVEWANEVQEEIKFIITDPEDYIQRAQLGCKSEKLTGELLGTRFQYILLGALSTRSYLKRENFAAESLLERYAEPLECLSVMHGGHNYKALIDQAWQLLMLNHAHDSIHGSSVDEVHDEMTSRYCQVRQIASGVAHHAMMHLADGLGARWNASEQGILLYKPTSALQGQYAQVWLPRYDGGEMYMTDETGQLIRSQRLNRSVPEENELGQPSALYYPTSKLEHWLFALPENAPMLSLVIAKNGERSLESDIVAGSNSIENEYLVVHASGTTLTIEDKRTGTSYPGLNLIEEQAEAGDCWDTSPTWIPSETVLSSRFDADIRVIERGPLRAQMQIQWNMDVPCRLEAGKRSNMRVNMPFTAVVSIYSGVARVDVELEFNNTAMDHKLSLIVSCRCRGDVLSQNAFGAFKRSPADSSNDSKCVQPSTRLFPFREWLSMSDGHKGIAVAAKGLYDYEPDIDRVTGCRICRFTLLRGVGNMSRINMKMRKGVAAWSVPTDSGQCRGLQRYAWAYFPLADTDTDCLLQDIEAYLYPPMAHAVRMTCTRDNYPVVPFAWDAPNIRFSAFKHAEDGDGYILRLYENWGNAACIVLRLNGFDWAAHSNLNEETGSVISIENQQISLQFSPYQIITLRLKHKDI